MDPSKRICLKNLPAGCTKREIAELIRNRTGTPIHSIDLGLGPDGEARHYAHFSCEGAKHVLDVIGAGIVLRDSTVRAEQAKMHYSFRYAEARRKREREDAEAQEELNAHWAAVTQRLMERTNGGELSMKKPPKDFYASRRRYATVATEIAAKSREMNAAATHGHAPTSSSQAALYHGAREGGSTAAGGAAATPHPHREGDAAAHIGGAVSGRRAAALAKKHGKGKAVAVQAPTAPPPPPEPTKEERKLSGLQAKLAALKEKMKK